VIADLESEGETERSPVGAGVHADVPADQAGACTAVTRHPSSSRVSITHVCASLV